MRLDELEKGTILYKAGLVVGTDIENLVTITLHRIIWNALDIAWQAGYDHRQLEIKREEAKVVADGISTVGKKLGKQS